MKKFKVCILGSPSIAKTYTIEGESLLDAIKSNFNSILKNSSWDYIPYRYPITVTPSYNKSLLGGKGGVELKLEWMYSNHELKPESKHTSSISIYADEKELENVNAFIMEN